MGAVPFAFIGKQTVASCKSLQRRRVTEAASVHSHVTSTPPNRKVNRTRAAAALCTHPPRGDTCPTLRHVSVFRRFILAPMTAVGSTSALLAGNRSNPLSLSLSLSHSVTTHSFLLRIPHALLPRPYLFGTPHSTLVKPHHHHHHYHHRSHACMHCYMMVHFYIFNSPLHHVHGQWHATRDSPS